MINSRDPSTRVSLQPAFVLHTYPWRETSLIAEMLTRDYGRVSVVAKGAKRPMSQYRGMLSPFCPLSISYSGKADIKTLTKCEWHGTVILPDSALMAAFYLNELLVRLLTRNDPVPRLFKSYFDVLKELSEHKNPSLCLRGFEVDLLNELGYGIPTVENDHRYQFVNGDWKSLEGVSSDIGIGGDILNSLKNKSISPVQDKEAKAIMRDILDYYLDGRPLNTRQIVTALKKI
ncbi:MAG: DNA repair protein RecO [Burkholderiales bacterium]|nr:DNA repair protein RecO [Burkholderiales bacterium]